MTRDTNTKKERNIEYNYNKGECSQSFLFLSNYRIGLQEKYYIYS